MMRMAIICVRLPEATIEQIADLSAQHHVDRSTFIRAAIRAAIINLLTESTTTPDSPAAH